MKVRADFVTNSSSSSFVALGVELDKLKIKSPSELYLKAFDALSRNSYVRSQNQEFFSRGDIGPQEKIEFVKQYIEFLEDDDLGDVHNLKQVISILLDDIWSTGKECPLVLGGCYDDIIGVKISYLLKEYELARVGDLKGIVARGLNTFLGANVKEEDIKYYEEAWYDG